MKQTITMLKLDSNKIADQGVQYIANALQKNTTLTTLDLSWNTFGDQGMQYLGNILQNNIVRLEFFLSISYLSLFLYRHSYRYLFMRIKSAIKGHII